MFNTFRKLLLTDYISNLAKKYSLSMLHHIIVCHVTDIDVGNMTDNNVL